MSSQLTSTVEKLIKTFGSDASLRQIAILSLVEDKPGLSTQDYAAALKLNKPAVTRAVMKMVDLGLVENKVNANDARARTIKLTKTGEKLLQKAA